MGDSTTDVDKSFADWQSDQSPQKLRTVVTHLKPTIDKAVRAYAPDATSIVNDRAQLIAAKAVKSYQAGTGASLHTHVYRQLQAIQRMAPQIQDPMPMSEQLRRDRAKLLRSIDQVHNDLGREPSDEEVSELAKLPIKRVIKVRKLLRSGIPMSVIEESDEDDDEAPDPVAHRTTPEDDWQDAVYHDLGDIDRVILQYRTGYRGAPRLSNQEVAQRLNLTPSAVTQRAAKIQSRLDEFYAPSRT